MLAGKFVCIHVLVVINLSSLEIITPFLNYYTKCKLLIKSREEMYFKIPVWAMISCLSYNVYASIVVKDLLCTAIACMI